MDRTTERTCEFALQGVQVIRYATLNYTGAKFRYTVPLGIRCGGVGGSARRSTSVKHGRDHDDSWLGLCIHAVCIGGEKRPLLLQVGSLTAAITNCSKLAHCELFDGLHVARDIAMHIGELCGGVGSLAVVVVSVAEVQLLDDAGLEYQQKAVCFGGKNVLEAADNGGDASTRGMEHATTFCLLEKLKSVCVRTPIKSDVLVHPSAPRLLVKG